MKHARCRLDSVIPPLLIEIPVRAVREQVHAPQVKPPLDAVVETGVEVSVGDGIRTEPNRPPCQGYKAATSVLLEPGALCDIEDSLQLLSARLLKLQDEVHRLIKINGVLTQEIHTMLKGKTE